MFSTPTRFLAVLWRAIDLLVPYLLCFETDVLVEGFSSQSTEVRIQVY